MEINNQHVFAKDGVLEIELPAGRHVIQLNSPAPSKEEPVFRIISDNAKPVVVHENDSTT